jgi:hypothetical protein
MVELRVAPVQTQPAVADRLAQEPFPPRDIIGAERGVGEVQLDDRGHGK